MAFEVTTTRVAQDRIQAVENSQLCLALRKEGKTPGEIAAALGLTTGNVRRLISKALDDIRVPDVNELRLLEAARLDEATEVVMREVRQGNLRAVDRLIALSARRSKLFGLDMPTQIEIDEEYHGPAILEVIPYNAHARPESESPEDSEQSAESADGAISPSTEDLAK